MIVKSSYAFIVQSSLTESFIENFVGVSVNKVDGYALVSDQLNETQVSKQLFTIQNPTIVDLVKRHTASGGELSYENISALEQELVHKIQTLPLPEQAETQALLEEINELLKAAAMNNQELLFIKQN